MMLGGAQAIDPTRPPAQSTAGAIQQISYQDARPILELFARSLPADLAAMSPGTREAAWPGWASRRNAGIRARLAQGDEDSIVNLLLFGTSFTKLPRAVNDSSRIGGRERAAEVVRGRITDLITAIDSPGANERLQFVRDVLGRRGINPATAAAREQARQYLLGAMKRVNGEVEGYLRAIESARSGAQRRGDEGRRPCRCPGRR